MSLICIFAYVCMPHRTSHWLYLCMHCIGCTSQLLLCRPAAPRHLPCLFTCSVCWLVTRSPATAAVFQTRAWFDYTFTSDITKWRSTALWVLERCRAMWCGWQNWRRQLSRSTVPFATMWHCRVLSDKRYADHIICCPHPVQVLIATTTDAINHRSFTTHPTTPAVRFIDVVYNVVATMCLLLGACCLPLATSFWWHSRFHTML